MIEETSELATTDELRHFLEADALEIQADPAFRESLRRKLWTLFRSRLAERPEERAREGDPDA